MAEPAQQRPEGEQRSVQRFMEGIIRNAELDANRVIAFLKRRGLKPLPPSQRTIPTGEKPTGPAANMLLNLAAALRLRSWEHAGITTSLPADLPRSADALAAVIAAAENGGRENTTEIPITVFKALLLRISRVSQTKLTADVALPVGVNADELLERLADFLYAHRYLMDEQKDAKSNGT